MNTRLVFPAVAPSLVAIAFALVSTRCDKDPPTRCGMASGPALARYYLVSGPSDMMAGSGACANLLMNGSSLPGSGTALPINGEALATEEYLPDQASASITNSTPRSMAIEPLWVINRIQDAQLNEGDAGDIPEAGPEGGPPPPGLPSSFSTYPYTAEGGANPQPALPPADSKNPDRPYAWGFFNSLYPDSNGVCTATLNPSIIDLPDIPEHTVNVYSSPDQSSQLPNDPMGTMWNGLDVSGTALGMTQPDQPATHVEYTWTNVRVLQTGASVGQQMWADLTITRDGCTASYHVALLSPQTTCAALDSQGNPTGPDLSQCSATAMPNVPSPTTGQLYGSGLPVGVPFDCIDINAAQAAADAGDGGGGGNSPDYECVLTTSTAP
jgi:hypothetical protein